MGSLRGNFSSQAAKAKSLLLWTCQEVAAAAYACVRAQLEAQAIPQPLGVATGIQPSAVFIPFGLR